VIEDTISHDKRLEMEDYPSLSKSTKTKRKKKKQVNKVIPYSFNSAEMRTRRYLQSRLGRYIMVVPIALEYLGMSILLFKFSKRVQSFSCCLAKNGHNLTSFLYNGCL
jgi:hypothetical protein